MFMKSFNFWRSLFFAALAVVGFAACSDDDNNGGGDSEASITVDGKSAVTIGVDAAAGETEAVEVVASGAWTLAFESEQDWLLPSVTSGKGGTTSLKFTVEALPAGSEPRSATAVLSVPGMIFGVAYTVDAKITVLQSEAGDIGESVLIYKETFGTAQVASNTNVDKYTAWDKTGEGAADVTYVGTNTSIRNTSPNTATSYPNASTAPILFFGAAPATFTVQNIALTPEQTRFQLTFGGQQTITYGSDYTWSNANLLVAISADGTTWSTLEYTTSDGDQNRDGNNWALATANFTLKAPAEKLFIRFTSPVLSSNLRIDDITLQTGLGGQVVDLEAGDPIPVVTISGISAVGDYEVKDATVIATYAAGFLMKDTTGIILVYPGSGATIPSVGKVVTVKGTVAAYGGVFQFGQGAAITETGEGTVPTAPEAVEVTADNIASFMTSPKVTYVKMTGTFVIDGNYRNLTFPFETSYKGSIQAPAADASFNFDELSGKLVDLTGWFLNTAGGTTYLSVLVTDIKANTTTPVLSFTTTPKVFAGSNPEVQKIDFTSQNIPTDAVIDFTFEGDDKDKFDVEAQDATSVTIKAVGDNNSGLAYNATLVAKYNNTTLAEVAVKQNAIPTGNDTKGTFTSMSGMLPTATNNDACYYAEKAKINGSDEAVGILKLGTGSKAGAFTTAAVGVTGTKKLSFYAAAWKGKSATLYIRVNEGGSVAPGSVALVSNDGVASSSPYTITFNDDTEYFTVELTDLTAASTITFSTDSTFNGGASNSTSGRALIAGIQIY